MSASVITGNIYTTECDAIVNCVNSQMDGCTKENDEKLFAAAGPDLKSAMAKAHYCFTTQNTVTEAYGLPCRFIIHAVAPLWLTGKANELKMLRLTYRNLYQTAEALGCKTIASPFLGTDYYRFPWEEAVHIGLKYAEESSIRTLFITDDPELYRTALQPYRRPVITSYIGWYRDHAYFALDNGLYARVDFRPEITDVDMIPNIEPCCRLGNNPAQIPLAEGEINRLRRIYEEYDW